MRKASKTPSKDAAKRLREQAAALRRAERSQRSGAIVVERVVADERVRELADKRLESFAPAAEALRDRVVSQLDGLEAELVYRDQQLIDEFISGIANLRRVGFPSNADPNYVLVANSQIDAILKVLTRK